MTHRDPFYSSDPFRDKKSMELLEVTVMVRYKDGQVTAHHKITNPWPYMISLRKQPNVATAWISKK